MTDSIDNAVTQSKNRAIYLGAAVKYLGKSQQRDAENLADLVVRHVAKIVAAANIKGIQPAGDIPADVKQLLEQLSPQILAHTEQIARESVLAITDVYVKTLQCAARALGNEPNEDG